MADHGKPRVSRSASPVPAARASCWPRPSSRRAPRLWASRSCRRRVTDPRPAAEPPRPRSSSSDEAIDYPEVQRPDINLVLSQAAYLKYAADTRPGGLLIYDSGLVETDAATDHGRARPAVHAGRDRRAGQEGRHQHRRRRRVRAVSGVLPVDAVEQAVLNRVPARFRELNEQAFRLGLRLADEAATQAMQDAAARPTKASEDSLDLLEHQGKTLFAEAGLPVLPAAVAPRRRRRAVPRKSSGCRSCVKAQAQAPAAAARPAVSVSAGRPPRSRPPPRTSSP